MDPEIDGERLELGAKSLQCGEVQIALLAIELYRLIVPSLNYLGAALHSGIVIPRNVFNLVADNGRLVKRPIGKYAVRNVVSMGFTLHKCKGYYCNY